MPKKKSEKENDDSLSRLKNVYRKKCEINNVQINKIFKDKLDLADQNGQMKSLQLTEVMGPVGLRSIIDSFIDIEYSGLKILKLLRVNAEDEGLRTICNYVNKTFSIEELNLSENGITKLGCEFLGKTLADPKCSLLKLKLDGNPIGTSGLHNLSIGLRGNSMIEKLSLKNCEIEQEGGRIIQIILANINSKICNLKLSQNNLQAGGLIEILKVLRSNDTLGKLTIRNIGVELIRSTLEEEELSALQLLKQIMSNNTVIKHYDIRFNPLTDKIAEELIEIVEKNKVIEQCKISEIIDVELKEKLRQVLEGRVVVGKKKGKQKEKDKQNEKEAENGKDRKN